MSRCWRAPLGLAALLLLLSGSTGTSSFTEADLAAEERKQMGGANEEAIRERVEESVGD